MHSAAARPSFHFTAPVGQDARRHFVEQGFVVVPGLVAPEEIAALKADLIAVARGAYPCPQIDPAPAGMADQQVLEHLLCIHQPHFISPVMRSFCTHPGITQVVGQVVGAHLPHWDGSVNCMQSMAFIKPPGKPGQAWHQDERYIPTRDRSLCGAWIAIDDATIENGCLWVVPGSHRDGYLFPTRPPADLDEYDGSDESHGFDVGQAVPVEVRAGSVVFFNGYLLHKSLRNRSQIYRRALVNHYLNAWSLLPWGQDDVNAAKGQVALANCRRIVPVCGKDPYAWQGTTAPPNEVHLRTFGKAWTAPAEQSARQ